MLRILIGEWRGGSLSYNKHVSISSDTQLEIDPHREIAPADRELTDWRTSLRQPLRCLGLLAADVAAGILAVALVGLGKSVVSDASVVSALSAARVEGLLWHGWSQTLIFIFLLAHLANRGHYTRRVPFWIELRELLTACAVALACDCLLVNTVNDAAYRAESVLRWVLFLPLLLCLRSGARTMLRRLGVWSLDTLIIGEHSIVDRTIAGFSSQPSLGYRFVGNLPPGAVKGMNSPRALQRLVGSFGAEFLMLAGRIGDNATEQRIIAMLDRLQIPFGYVSELETLPVGRSGGHYFFSHNIAFLIFNNDHLRPVARFLKRAIDIVVASMLVVLVAPTMLIIAAMIRFGGDSGGAGPVLFRQRRIGRNGVPYYCLKFRTMRVDAAQILKELLASNPAAAAEWNLNQKLANDPRITRFGRILRRTSLDELPQLFNVVRGDMSLVGPRPIVQAEVARYGEDIAYYYETRPGMTGLWQVSGRSETSYKRRVQLDVWYVRNWSVWHDVVILLKTFPALLSSKGAV